MALIRWNVLTCCPSKYQMLFMISGDYCVRCCVRNSFDKMEYIYIAQSNPKHQMFVMVSGDILWNIAS